MSPAMLAARWAAAALGCSTLGAACASDRASERAPAPVGGDAPTASGAAGSADGGAAAEPASGNGGASGGAGGDDAALAGAAGAPESGCELFYEAGHGDLYIHDDAGLQVSVRAAFGGIQETTEQASRVCVLVPQASYALADSLGGVPDRPDFGFLGLAAGSAFWLLPAAPRVGIPWLGASTESLPPARYADDEVVLSLAVLERPAGGQVAVWSTSPIGSPDVLFATSSGAKEHAFPVGAHLHFNWGFTRPGDYALELQASAARLGSGGEAGAGGAGGPSARETSPAARLRFLVEP